jgi:hypothetical protein
MLKRKLNGRTVRPSGLPLLVAQRQGGLPWSWHTWASGTLGPLGVGASHNADTIVSKYMLLKPTACFIQVATKWTFQQIVVPMHDSLGDTHDR